MTGLIRFKRERGRILEFWNESRFELCWKGRLFSTKRPLEEALYSGNYCDLAGQSLAVWNLNITMEVPFEEKTWDSIPNSATTSSPSYKKWRSWWIRQVSLLPLLLICHWNQRSSLWRICDCINSRHGLITAKRNLALQNTNWKKH